MRSRPTGFASFASNPTMVGALTVLIVVVAVFLAYNANNGLPFVPTYRISATVPNANSLVEGNDVRMGGVRVGVVETITPEVTEDPETGEQIYGAQLNLKLDRNVEPLPADSTLIIRSRSALGLKFLEVTPGSSDEGLPEGGALPITQAQPEPVELDEVFSTFDETTRRYSQENLLEFGNAIAGRGGSLNAALFELAPLTRDLVPVMRNIGSKATVVSNRATPTITVRARIGPPLFRGADDNSPRRRGKLNLGRPPRFAVRTITPRVALDCAP